MVTSPTKKLFTVEEYEELGRTNVIPEDSRVELIEGEIIHMSPIGDLHHACVNRLNAIFSKRLKNEEAIVSIQNPIQLGEKSQPLPDVTTLKPCEDFYARGKPRAKDILLLIEVADTSLQYDREEKIPLYAKYGIIEVWLVNLITQKLEVYRESTSTGYENVYYYDVSKNISPILFPDLTIAISNVIGQQTRVDE